MSDADYPPDIYYTPGQDDGKNPGEGGFGAVPTQFTPQKPAGPDPVTPAPLAEGTDSPRHAQVYAYDTLSGNFQPVEWIAGAMSVSASIDASGITIGAVIVGGAAKGTTVAAEATSTPSGPNHQLIDVALYDASGNQLTATDFGAGEQHTADSGTDLYTPGTSIGTMSLGRVVASAPTLIAGRFSTYNLSTAGRMIVDGSEVTQPVSGTFWQATQPVSGTIAVSNFPATQPVSGSVSVLALPALPAGANAIGTVGVTALPALPAGANAIGTVGVTALPALPAGANAIGTVGVTALPALPAGANAIGGTFNVDNPKATYSAVASAITFQAAATDIFTIFGSASKTIRITKLVFSGSQTVGSILSLSLVVRSAVNTGGTSAASTAVPHDSTNPAATATVLSYTANPTGLGTAVGDVGCRRVNVGYASGANSVGYAASVLVDAYARPAQAIVLRGTAQGLCLNVNGGTAAGNVCCVEIEWTEE